MADLLSHALVGWIAGARVVDRAALGWVVSGALLPDIASRMPPVVINGAVEAGVLRSTPELIRLVLGLDFPHTPIGTLVVALLCAVALPERLVVPWGRWRVASLLSAGAITHLLVDAVQVHIVPGYAWLYPFSAAHWELGWLSTEASLVALPLLALVAWAITPKGGRSKERPPLDGDVTGG